MNFHQHRGLPPFLFAILFLFAFYLNIHQLDSYPTGISFDEATNVVDAGLALQSRRTAFMFYTDARVELLYRHFLMLGGLAGGQTIFAYRLVNVCLGLLSVAAAGAAAQAFFLQHSRRRQQTAMLIAMSSLAANPSFMAQSRGLYRGLPAILFVLLFLAFWWRAVYKLQRGAPVRQIWLNFAGAGLCLGLTMHTYTSALFAAALLPLGAVWLLRFWPQWRAWLGGVLLAGAILALFLAPLFYLLQTNPERVFGRSEDVANTETPQLLRDLLTFKNTDYLALHLEWTKIRYLRKGDLNPQYNSARAPLMPRFSGPLFYLAVFFCLLTIYRVQSVQVLALLVLSLIPVLLSNEFFHGLRIILGLAVVPLLCGVAVGYLPLDKLPSAAFGLLFALISVYLASEIPRIQADYRDFLVARDPAGNSLEAGELAMGEWYFLPQNREAVNYLAGLDSALYMPLVDIQKPHLRAMLLADYPQTHSWTVLGSDEFPPGLIYTQADFDQSVAQDYKLLVWLDRAHQRLILLPPLSDAAARDLAEQAQNAPPIYSPERPDWLMGKTFPLNTFDFAPSEAISPLIFGERVQSLRFFPPDEIQTGVAQDYCFLWEAIRPIERKKWIYLQVWSADFYGLTGTVDEAMRWIYPTATWEVGESIPTCHRLILAPDSPSGLYWLVASFLEVEANIPPWQVGPNLGDAAPLAALKIPQSDPPPLPRYRLDLDFATPEGQIIRLEGYDLKIQDDELSLSLSWQSTGRTAIPYTIFVHLTDAQGQLLAQQDSQPWDGQYPTIIWDAGEQVQTQHLLSFPPKTAHLYVGLYSPYDFARLQLDNGGADRIEIPLE